MDRLESLASLVKREVSEYAGPSPDTRAYAMEDVSALSYAVLVVPVEDTQKTTVMIMARIEGDTVIIETDKTDRPLLDALVQAGIPRDHIVLAYQGEATPTP